MKFKIGDRVKVKFGSEGIVGKAEGKITEIFGGGGQVKVIMH
jgi:hypothetical protein